LIAACYAALKNVSHMVMKDRFPAEPGTGDQKKR
jgi:hypothetical protein